jgi:hypothetical protein
MALAIASVAPALAGAQDAPVPTGPPPLARTDNRLSTVAGFTVDFPKKDWNPIVGTGSSVVVFVHKDRDATVAVERTKVPNPLSPKEITDEIAVREEEDWLARRPLSTDYSHQFVEYRGAKIILIDLKQPGPRGQEHVRLYTLPRGNDWFRVICTTLQPSFDKHKETCHRIALSVTPVQPPSTTQ